MAEQRPIKRGDKAHIPGRGEYEVKVMAVADGWAMVRRPRAIPFCVMVKELERVDG